MLVQFLINGLILGAIYAALSLGFSLVYNTTKIFHIAYAVLYMVAGYFLYSFYTILKFPYLLAVVFAVVLTILLSLAIEFLIYRPLDKKKASLNIYLISSLGVMIIIINTIALYYGNETKIITSEIAKSVTIGETIITYPQLYQFGFSILFIIIFLLISSYTKLGITIRALSNDSELAKVQGLNISNTRIVLFALSGFFAALTGILMAQDIGLDPYVGMPMLLNAVVALIIGGIGKFSSSIIGGFIIGILQALVVWQFSANWEEAITFTLLILFLIFRPQGIFGNKTRHV